MNILALLESGGNNHSESGRINATLGGLFNNINNCLAHIERIKNAVIVREFSTLTAPLKSFYI